MKRHLFLGSTALLAACAPSFSENDSLVSSVRILAVKSEPAEAKPGTPLALTAFLAVPPGVASPADPRWSFCVAPKPVTENNVVSAACLASASLVPAGEGVSVQAATPADACTLFGPNTPAGGYRPRDPDATGGYFQPLRVDLPSADPTFHLERVLCNLAAAPADVAAAFGLAYVPNQNPQLAPVSVTLGGQGVGFDEIPNGASVGLRASWSASDAESYAYFDPVAQAISTRREAMSVAWYVSGGKLDTESTGRAQDDLALDSENTWAAPSNAGPAKLWVVLRDSRGGVDFATYDVTILP
jgi:hypothetical protein